MPLAILTYHPMRVLGPDAASNDLVAFTEDLRMLERRGWPVVALRAAIDAWLADPSSMDRPCVAITCDDGSDFDFEDLPHPAWGPQRSILNRARDASAGGQPVHVTTFAIVSPEARAALDASCMVGKGWWNESWWRPAVASGLMHVASHSWDHNHDALPADLALPVARGTFTSIASERLADREIRDAQAYLSRKVPNPGLGLFAYPYGEANEYLVREYLPQRGRDLGLVAAFGTEPGVVRGARDRWSLPRFVHARDWNTSDELEAMLQRAF